MYWSFTFVLLLTGSTFFLVNGDWLDNLYRFEKEKRNFPNVITLNKEVKHCGTTLPDFAKCGCQALLCNAEQKCEHTTAVMGGYKYTIGCQLLKPWHEIDLEDASAGGDEADCKCGGKAMKA